MTEITAAIAAVLSTLAAIFSGMCAFLSYQLSKKIRDELKSDETIIVSRFIRANLKEPDHAKCVIKCNIFNKSKRKVYVSNVNVYGKGKDLLDVSWLNQINKFGEPLNPCKLIGIVDTEELFIRQNNGEEINYCRIEILHSFSSTPINTVFDWYNNG